MPHAYDVVILGSGFAGSIAALAFERRGLRTAVVDKARHPRFAIGESSTPVANRVLADLARKYDLPRLAPLAQYGSWQRRYPRLGCGPKRGFSYFQHQANRPFVPRADHANELLVAASADDEHSDTQWLRADVDAFLAGEMRAAGIPLWEGATIRELTTALPIGNDLPPIRSRTPASVWTVRFEQDETIHELHADFLIDGTGEAGLVLRARGVSDEVHRLCTNSRALFSHFHGVRSWTDWLSDHGGHVADHPFRCDDAAQHQLLDDAWMWLLRFNQGVTSVGLAIDARRSPCPDELPPADEWQAWLDRYPSVGELLGDARLAEIPGRFLRSGRLQRRAARAVGVNWAALPHTAGFIDPLHSSGIAHSLCGVERLVGILASAGYSADQADRLAAYERTVFRELALIDRLVDGCYRSLGRFDLFSAWSMFYFAAATTYERLRAESVESGEPVDSGFLCANDEGLFQTVMTAHDELVSVTAEPYDKERESRFIERVAEYVRPYNRVGLCDPTCGNMYRYTVAPE